MVGLWVLGILTLLLGFAVFELRRVYRAAWVVGSEEWNTRQLALRERLEALDSLANPEYEPLRERYEQRLRLGAARGLFADDAERQRAQVLGLHDALYRHRDEAEVRELLEREQAREHTEGSR